MRNFGLAVIFGLATFVFEPVTQASFTDKCVALTKGSVHPFCTTVYPSSAGDPTSYIPTNIGPGNSFQLLSLLGTFSCPGNSFIEVNVQDGQGTNRNQWYGRSRSGVGKNLDTGVLYRWTLVAGGCPASPTARKGASPLMSK
jgi:hypothetical protein